MELILKRIAKRKGYTIGRLYEQATPLPSSPEGEEESLSPTLPSVASGDSLPFVGSNPHLVDSLTTPVAQGEGEVSPRGDLEGASPRPLRERQGEGPLYLCDTLEPTWRDYKNGGRKIPGRSAIPEGRYLVLITWSPKFEQWLPLLWNVPKFSGIRIHAGNKPEDTEGCILVGKNQQVGRLVDSRFWVQRLKQEISDAHERGEKVYLTVK